MELSPAEDNLFSNPNFFFPASTEDTSRSLSISLFPNTMWDDININYCSQIDEFGNTYDVNAVTLYCGVKIRQPNQYGQVGSNTYIPVDSCVITDDRIKLLL